MSKAMTIDKDLTLKIESQIDDLRRYKDSVHLGALLVAVEQMLGSQHLLVSYLKFSNQFKVCSMVVSRNCLGEGVGEPIIFCVFYGDKDP